MSSKSEKADVIKDHAIHGRFDQIEVKFGEKAAIKGREYVRNNSNYIYCQSLIFWPCFRQLQNC